MTVFMKLRDKIRSIFASHDVWFFRLGHGILVFIGLMIINEKFGYATFLDHFWVPLVIAALCAFTPRSAGTLVCAVYLVMHMLALDSGVAVCVILFLAVGYIIVGAYHVKRVDYLMSVPLCHQINVPFLLPMEGALIGSISDVAAIAWGSVFSYLLRSIASNSALLVDEDEAMTMTDLILQEMITNPMFYIFLVSMILLFLVTYVVRCRDISHAWVIGVISGVVVQFMIMLAGYLFTGRSSQIPTLIIADILTLALGLLITFLFRDLDYSRVEKVQFEDDDYYYYVTAVPKIHLTEEVSQVKKINTVSQDTMPIQEGSKE